MHKVNNWISRMEDRNEGIEPFREEMLKMCRRGAKTDALKIIQSRMEEILNDGPMTPQNRIRYNDLYCLLFEIGDSIKNGNIRRDIHSNAMDYDVYNLRIAILIAHQSSTGPMSKFLTNLKSSLDMVEKIGMQSTLEQLNKEITDIKTKTGNGIEEELSDFKKIIEILLTKDEVTPVTKKKKKSKKSRKRKRHSSETQQNSKQLNCNNMENIPFNIHEPSTSLTQIGNAVFIDFSEPNIIPGLIGVEKKNGENLGTKNKSKTKNPFTEARKNEILHEIRSYDNITVNNRFISNFRKPKQGSGLNILGRKNEIIETNKSMSHIDNGPNNGDTIKKLDIIETLNNETVNTGFISNFREPNKGAGVNRPKRNNEMIEIKKSTTQIENGPNKGAIIEKLDIIETLNNEKVNNELVEARTTNEDVETNENEPQIENISNETGKIKKFHDIGTMTNEIIDNDVDGNIGEESNEKERIINEKEDFLSDAGKNQNLHNGNITNVTNEDTADFNEASEGQQLNDKDKTYEQVMSNGSISQIDNFSKEVGKNRELNNIKVITDVTIAPDTNIKIENNVLESNGVTESNYDSSDDCVEIIVEHEIIVID